MNTKNQITTYIASQPDPKRTDMQSLHEIILCLLPGCQEWFLDGKNSEGKVVSNPNIGYGKYTITYADASSASLQGKSREFYQIGLSGNTTGISVYVMGLEDKKFLANTFGKEIGKASVSGYCIKFKALKDIDVEVLKKAILAGVDATSK